MNLCNRDILNVTGEQQLVYIIIDFFLNLRHVLPEVFVQSILGVLLFMWLSRVPPEGNLQSLKSIKIAKNSSI